MIKLGIGAAPGTDGVGETEFAENPQLQFECEQEVVDQIREHVHSGFQRVSRGGIEVAGVVFGVREENCVRLLATHPIFCEYKTGPTVVLSERDRAALREFLDHSRMDTRFESMEALGWYVSHRTGVELLDRDLVTFDEFFDQPGQLTLVVRAERKGGLPSAIYTRDINGEADIDRPTLEWEIPPAALPQNVRGTGANSSAGASASAWGASTQPLPESTVRPIRVRRWEPAGGGAAAQPAASYPAWPQAANLAPEPAPQSPAWTQAAPHHQPAYEQNTALVRASAYNSVPTLATFSGSATPALYTGGYSHPALDTPAPSPERRAKWEWLVAWAACLALLGIVGYGYYIYSSPAPLNLKLAERDGQIEATWSHGMREMFYVSGGAVEIRENGLKREFNLSKQQLESGSFSYVTDAQDVAVRLRVSGFGRTFTESARFVGNRPQATRIKGAADIREERDRLMRENYMMRANQSRSGETVKQLEQRIEQLEKLLKQQAQDPNKK